MQKTAKVTVWAECKRRNRCRYGLKGVLVRLIAEDETYTIEGSGWGQKGPSGADLELDLLPGRVTFPEPQGKTWVLEALSAAKKPLPPCLTVRADEVVLLSAWPVVCCEPSRKRRTA